MDILGLFDRLFSSFSTHMKMKNSEDPTVNQEVNAILNDSPYKNEIKQRKLELEETRKQNKIQKSFNKKY